ncbi:oxysterol-binding protein-related protein 8-like [Protopterus annectens]|uniref:oxysterol-binding protein-related protein 8-like n=1 Tax=Protopterus annectens TaxID=7888 RepID=UPI001CFAC52A|nr:oxysterol-binding protein-related protein 8-like [Protopterus annectens]
MTIYCIYSLIVHTIKKSYKEEKKKSEKEFFHSLTDPSLTMMEDWLKIRGTFRMWSKLWCDLKPGMLLIHKSPKKAEWVGTVLLNVCEFLERPLEKDGFCFKLFHPFKQSIWAVKGPKGQIFGCITTQPLPRNHLIIRTVPECYCFTYIPRVKANMVDLSVDVKMFLRQKNFEILFNGLGKRESTSILKKKSTFNPPLHPQLKNFENVLQTRLRDDLKFNKVPPNLTKDEFNILDSCRTDKNLRVMKPDKGGGVILMDQIDYEVKMLNMLNDENTYERVSLNEFIIAERKVSICLNNLILEGLIDLETYNYLHVEKSKIPSIFGIPKVHKNHLDTPLRHIVTAEGSLTAPLAKYIGFHLKPFILEDFNILKDSDNEIEEKNFKNQKLHSDTSDKESELGCEKTYDGNCRKSGSDISERQHESDNIGLGESGCDSLERQDELGNDVLEKSGRDFYEKQEHSYVEPVASNFIKESTYVEEVRKCVKADDTKASSENIRSVMWSLLKQAHAGIDLGKISLPTSLLEPRSLLDTMSDYCYHMDILSVAAAEDNAYSRFKNVVKWYLSGFYQRAEGLKKTKKPYSPALGETFRCMWVHPETKSRTFYIAEQVSQHPSVSAFYVSNRKDGFCFSGSLLVKTNFCGNSFISVLEGSSKLIFLKHKEDYTMTQPQVHTKGILSGTLMSELGGTVSVKCETNSYSAEIDFRLKPFFGGSLNQVFGKLKKKNEVLSALEGHWDGEVTIQDKKNGIAETLWNPLPEVRQHRLTRYTIQPGELGEFESQRYWKEVTEAILNKDDIKAANEKCILVEAQKKAARERAAQNEEWVCKLFEQDLITKEWHYKYADFRPWDPIHDLMQFEKDGIIQTRVKHQTQKDSVQNIKKNHGDQPKDVKSDCSSAEPRFEDSSRSECELYSCPLGEAVLYSVLFFPKYLLLRIFLQNLIYETT